MRSYGETEEGTMPIRGSCLCGDVALDNDPQMHIFVGSKAPWHEIADALLRHEAYPPGLYPPPQREA
jgi:hypothetical protein